MAPYRRFRTVRPSVGRLSTRKKTVSPFQPARHRAGQLDQGVRMDPRKHIIYDGIIHETSINGSVLLARTENAERPVPGEAKGKWERQTLGLEGKVCHAADVTVVISEKQQQQQRHHHHHNHQESRTFVWFAFVFRSFFYFAPAWAHQVAASLSSVPASIWPPA